ncbi:Clavaminate synthase-like protein [Armillaria novae-zelandiae]|uniref:Clavaminate synthase-like protein n=1 Tax=Armillaria novae-zelandiae TaxID=153914 RepID=A0AA39P962_9AGAR|nr:Clavaminate synthase-like protein [Armillaria novae-zelandiae]
MAIEISPLLLPDSAEAFSFLSFGRQVKGFDPTNFTQEEFAAIENALYKHGLLLFRNVDLSPEKQYTLNSLIGNGTGYNHEGITGATLKHPSHMTFHKTYVPPEDEAKGATRFFRRHINAALYDRRTPKVTTLYAINVPKGPRQTCRYDDGTGDELPVPLGTTAFISGKTMFEILPPELKSLAVRSKVKYAPLPYVWMVHAHDVSTGLGLESEGIGDPIRGAPVVGGGEADGASCSMEEYGYGRAPWTGGKKEGALYPDGAHLTDLKEVRELLYKMQRSGIAPKLVYPHDWNEKDLVLFHNRGVLHSVVGAFNEDQVRAFHQCNLAASDDPVGPTADDVKKWS